ncbi:hypothetical protein QFC21_004845 [Naganishia friedmannii]|uniref:Uncharacterized protein n=1 Tax=Naganishia friedmannii TaxID=89922 RepID=A0ACC2VDN2_9TREE|nr:hypothetical protein QFC21_004845 [Naganishia friedmannii]
MVPTTGSHCHASEIPSIRSDAKVPPNTADGRTDSSVGSHNKAPSSVNATEIAQNPSAEEANKTPEDVGKRPFSSWTRWKPKVGGSILSWIASRRYGWSQGGSDSKACSGTGEGPIEVAPSRSGDAQSDMDGSPFDEEANTDPKKLRFFCKELGGHIDTSKDWKLTDGFAPEKLNLVASIYPFHIVPLSESKTTSINLKQAKEQWKGDHPEFVKEVESWHLCFDYDGSKVRFQWRVSLVPKNADGCEFEGHKKAIPLRDIGTDDEGNISIVTATFGKRT